MYVENLGFFDALNEYVNNDPAPRFMRVSILPDDIARNLDVVISRGRVQPGFRDDKYIIIPVNNRLLDQLKLLAWSHWPHIKMSDSNVDLSALWFFPPKNWEAQGSVQGRG